MQLLGGFLKVLPRALGANFQSAGRVRGPTVVTLVEEVVWVGVMSLLGSVIAGSV